MPGSTLRWPRVERLDADRVAAAVDERLGVGLQVEGLCPGGQVGAAYVRWPDGHLGVLSWQAGRSAEIDVGPVEVIEALREVGYPAPRIELAGAQTPKRLVVWN